MNTIYITDTIAAIATGNVISAIGIVRVSGNEAITAADCIFKSSAGISLADAVDRHMYYGELFDDGGELIDLCLCMISRGPNSYTGEDTVEFHCHGSPVVLSEVLQSLFAHGVRQAEAGEFTKRAFLNGRMDLTQAEAVIDLIEAETPYGAKNAAGQLYGAVCEKINTIYDRLLDVMAHFHAVIDYPDEDIDEFELQSYLSTLRESSDKLRRLLDTHERGKLLHTGIPTAIVGRANTGKSSLLNALLGYERAIVTDIAGTTRDTVEEKVVIGNLLLRLIDTAGLRKTDDTIEKLGLERTLAALDRARLVLVVLDGSEALNEDDYGVLERVSSLPEGVPVVYVVNKSDLLHSAEYDASPLLRHCGLDPQSPADLCRGGILPPAGLCRGGILPPAGDYKSPLRHISNVSANTVYESIISAPQPYIHLSAKTGEGVDRLCAKIQELFPAFDNAPAGEIITSVRQAEAISRAAESLDNAIKALSDQITSDAVLTDIEAALGALGEVTGKTMREDIVSRIFARFCVGK